MKTSLFAISVFLLALSSVSYASASDARQTRQQARIAAGVASGELTARETVRLEREQHRIAKTEAAFKADGNYTWKERAVVNHKQNKASAHIARQKHDRQSR